MRCLNLYVSIHSQLFFTFNSHIPTHSYKQVYTNKHYRHTHTHKPEHLVFGENNNSSLAGNQTVTEAISILYTHRH